MKLLSSKRGALTVAVVILVFVVIPAVIVAGSAGIQAARLVDDLSAPAFGSPVSADLHLYYAALLGGAIIAVVALIASVTIIVVALNRPTVVTPRNATN